MDLATGLKTAGLQVAVLTPQYASSWPQKLQFRELTVHRPVRMFRTGWTARGDRTASRYIRYLRDWLIENRDSSDLFYCDGCREESIAALEAARELGIPMAARIGGNGSCSDLEFFKHHRMGKRCRATALAADAVVLGSAAAQRRWIAECGASKSTCRIPVGVGPTPDQGLSSPQRLRQSLARINGDFYVPDHCSVVLSVERMRQDSGVMTLVNSAYALSQKVAGLQYWLVGDGPLRDSIYTHLKADGLRQSVAMPGSFGVDEDVFAAANLMVQVGDEGFDHQIPTAIAAALPLLMANTETARAFFEISDAQVRQRFIERRTETAHCDAGGSDAGGSDAGGSDAGGSDAGEQASATKPGQLVWWFDPARPKTLRLAIDQIVNHPQAARARAQQLRKHFQRTRPRSESIARYIKLFQQLVQGKSKTTHDSMPMGRAQ